MCLVTDRRRLCDDLAPLDVARACLIEQARLAVEAGIDLVQVRERDLDAHDLARLVTEIAGLARGSRTRVVVNDRVDVALASGVDGVHLGGGSLPADAVRRMVPPGFLIGRSVHRADEAARAGRVDYLIAGTVFTSASKPSPGPLLGPGGLADIVRATRIPVLAIGGITVERAREVAAAGASGIAAIGLFIGAKGGGSCRATPLGPTVAQMRLRFDSAEPPS